jgi:hypothetical protein
MDPLGWAATGRTTARCGLPGTVRVSPRAALRTVRWLVLRSASFLEPQGRLTGVATRDGLPMSNQGDERTSSGFAVLARTRVTANLVDALRRVAVTRL